jgi:hypothetical protein
MIERFGPRVLMVDAKSAPRRGCPSPAAYAPT